MAYKETKVAKDMGMGLQIMTSIPFVDLFIYKVAGFHGI